MKKVLSMLLVFCLLSTCVAMAEGGFTPGTYTGVGQGRNGEITVEVTLNDSGITDIQVVNSEETPSIGGVAMDSLIAEIVDTQSLAADAMTGATESSRGLMEAVSNALTAAGADPELLMKAAVETTKEQVELSADVVIVGAGGAGLTAAVEAARAGASVIVIEAQAFPGGSTGRAGGWLLSAATEEEAAEHGSLTAEQLAEEFEIYGTEYHDRELSEAFMNNLNENRDWIVAEAKEYGYEISRFYDPGFYPLDPADESTMDYTVVYNLMDVTHETLREGDGCWITSTLYEEAKKAGAEFYLDTTATELLSENGAATGIVAVNKNGTTYSVYGKSIILACGGYGANMDLVAKYCGADPENFIYHGAPSNTGFGIVAGESIGARIEHDPSFLYNGNELYNTVGGLVVNGNTEVLDANNQPIPNLYAAGEICCVTVMDPGLFTRGHNIAWDINSGRIAGQVTAARATETEPAA